MPWAAAALPDHLPYSATWPTSGPHAYQSWRELVTLPTGGSPWTVEVLKTGFRLPPEVADFVAPLDSAAQFRAG